MPNKLRFFALFYCTHKLYYKNKEKKPYLSNVMHNIMPTKLIKILTR